MDSVTAHGYAGIRTSQVFRHGMESGYTLTLIRGRAPREALRAMGAEPRGTGEGTAGLIEADDAHRAEVDYDYGDESYVAGTFSVPGENGDWTLVLGFDGGLGIAGACAETLSRGGRVVAHSTNGGKPIHLFHWFEDGELRTTFEDPSSRDGNTPVDFLPRLQAGDSSGRPLGFLLHRQPPRPGGLPLRSYTASTVRRRQPGGQDIACRGHVAVMHDAALARPLADVQRQPRRCWPDPATPPSALWSGTPAPASTQSPGTSPNPTPPPGGRADASKINYWRLLGSPTTPLLQWRRKSDGCLRGRQDRCRWTARRAGRNA